MENVKIKSASDGLMLDVIIMVPKGDVKGIIQISHGMAEHKERYIPFMEFLNQKGYITIIHDHRGHGKSVKMKEDLGYFYEEKAEFVVEDLHQITAFVKNKYPNQKVTLLGHSMGSMMVRKYIKKYDDEIDQLIVCGSPSKNPLINVALFLVNMIKIFKGDRYRSDLVQNLAFGKYTKKFQILFIAGVDDQVIVSEKKWVESQVFLRKLGYENITKILYSNMRHEILNEKNKEIVWKDVCEWIEKE